MLKPGEQRSIDPDCCCSFTGLSNLYAMHSFSRNAWIRPTLWMRCNVPMVGTASSSCYQYIYQSLDLHVSDKNWKSNNFDTDLFREKQKVISPNSTITIRLDSHNINRILIGTELADFRHVSIFKLRAMFWKTSPLLVAMLQYFEHPWLSLDTQRLSRFLDTDWQVVRTCTRRGVYF